MKVLFIQTGGTIDKDYPRITKGYAFEITTPAVSRILENANPDFDFEIIPLLQKDSLDINVEDRLKIRETIENSESEKIIITHGTDTMLETARFLSDLKGKLIIITGAMRPERFSNSDASFNLGLALGALNVLDNGVFIAMNGRILEYDKAKRDLTSGRFMPV